MATDLRRMRPIALLLLLLPFFSYAQKSPVPLEIEKESDDYSFTLGDDGQPLFTQIISWDPVEFVLKYGLEIQNSLGEGIYLETSVEPRQSVSLSAGTYQYRIILYNLLDKPELKSQWIPLVILKAQHPLIDSVSPLTIFLDEENPTVTVSGEDLMADAKVYLVDPILGIPFYQGQMEKNEENKRLSVLLPWNRLDTGLFKVKVVNSGGLNAVSEATIRVKLSNPFEGFVLAGIAMSIPVQDREFANVWSDPLYPLGYQARGTFVFSKKRFGYFGVEGMFVSKYLQTSTGSGITIDMNMMNAGLGFLYKFRATPRLFLIARAGGSLAFTAIEFTYSNVPGLSTASMDISLSSGIAVQYLYKKHWLFEGGVDYPIVLYKAQTAGLVVPSLSAGYLF